MTVSVLIITRNRPAEIDRCVASLELVGDLICEVLVLDNASDVPIASVPKLSVPVRVRRVDVSLSPTEARNGLAMEATGDCLLIMDDDAYILNNRALSSGLKIMQEDESVGAIAFAQCDSSGNLPPGFGQGAPVDYTCLTCGFAAYAALLRIAPYRKLGGFQKILQYYGEEQEYCKRLWNAGYSVVWTPERSFAHLPSDQTRDHWRKAFLTLRNNWIAAALLEPLPLLILSFPVRLRRQIQYSRYICELMGTRPAKLFTESTRSALHEWRAIWTQRTPLDYGTIWRWEKLKRTYPKYNPVHTQGVA